MKKDKIRLIIMAILTTTLFTSLAIWAIMSVYLGKANQATLLPIIITLLIILFMVFFIIRRFKDIKEGQPLEDERSKKIITLAAARTFYISLYWLLFVSYFENYFAKMVGSEYLTANQTVGAGVGGMAIIFFISWIIFNKKSKLI
jgi:hypothetical protein